MTIIDRLVEELQNLTEDQQTRVFEFVQQIQRQTEKTSKGVSPLPPGIPGEALIAWARDYPIPPDDLEKMQRAIEEDCERIDDDWDE